MIDKNVYIKVKNFEKGGYRKEVIGRLNLTILQKNFLEMKNIEDEIKNQSYNKAYELYGNPLPKNVQDRLEQELTSIIKNNFASIYILAQQLVKKSNEDGYIVGYRGGIGASFIAFLLGITEINPLYAHYRCLKCKKSDFSDYGVENGMSLVDKICPICKENLIKDGMNIPFEVFAGTNGEEEPYISLNFSINILDKINSYISEVITECSENDLENYTLLKLDILGHDDQTMLHMLHELTGVSPRDITLDDKETISIFNSTEALGVSPKQINSSVGTFGIPEFGNRYTRDMLFETKPTTFEELVKISGLLHGTNAWNESVLDLIQTNKATLKEVIATREDIILYLKSKKVNDNIAYEIMKSVYKGNGLTAEQEEIMRKCKIPEWYINSCNEIKYLFPKAHAANYVANEFKIAWYKVHRPLAFYTAYFNIKAQTINPKFMKNNKNIVIEQMKKIQSSEEVYDNYLYNDLEIILEIYERGFEFLPIEEKESNNTKFIIEKGKIRPPIYSKTCLDYRHSFYNFVVDNRDKEFAFNVANIVSSNFPNIEYNPMYIWDETQIEGTNLMHAIGNKIFEKNPNAKILYITAEEFLNDVVESVKYKKFDVIEKYSNLDVLLIDNIQNIAKMKTSQEKFFYIFDNLYRNGKQIVISGNTLPKDITNLNENLKCRFEWGIFVWLFSTEKTLQINNDYFKKFFKELIVDERNEEAYVEVKKIGNNKEIKYPLIFYGENDILKIHLMNVLEYELRVKEKIIRILSGNFIDEIVNGVTKSNLTEIDEKYKSADAVIIEDIDYIVGKKSTQLELYYIAKYCIENNKKIIFTSRLKVEELHLDDKLKELLRLGKSIEIKNV